MLESDLRAKSEKSFKLEKLVHGTLVQGVMLFPQLTITCEIIPHIVQCGTEYGEIKAIPIQAKTGP